MVSVIAGRAVAHRHRADLLQRDRRVPGGVRAATRSRMDRGARTLVRGSTRAGRFHGRLHGASCRDHAAQRRLVRCDRRSKVRVRALSRSGEPPGRRCGVLSAGRSAAPAGRLRGRRGELSKREPVGVGAAAGPRAAAARAGARRGGFCGNTSSSRNATTDRTQRAKLLPAGIEIMLTAGDIEEARRECDELEGIARDFETGEPGILGTMAAQARGEVELAEGEALAALVSLRCAWRAWLQIDAPYMAARVRVLAGAGVPRPGRRGRRRPGAPGGANRVRATRCRSGSRARRLAIPRDASAAASPELARAAGIAAGRRRENQQGDRRRARRQRTYDRSSCQQHLRKARCAVTRRRNSLCLPASTGLNHRNA